MFDLLHMTFRCQELKDKQRLADQKQTSGLKKNDIVR